MVQFTVLRIYKLFRKVLFIMAALFWLFSGPVYSEGISSIARQYKDSLFEMTEKKLYGVEMIISGREMKTGVNRIDMIIHDSSNNDVEGAEINVTPWMPQMDHGSPEKPTVTDIGAGFYFIENIVFSMGGQWELRIEVKKDAVIDLAVFEFPDVIDIDGAGKLSATTYDNYRKIFTPLPAIPPIPADNPMTSEKIRLGKMLYWDRRVSKTGATSCVFCHHPSYYGAEPMRQSVGINGEVHIRNAQTVLNSAFLSALLWAGESPTLEHQVLSAIKSHVAMRSRPDEVAERLNRIPGYRELSMKVFEGPLTEENIGKAIAAFMRTLVTPNYPFARWLMGDDNALTEKQKRGMALFADKGCIGCHHGPVFSGPVHNPDIKVFSLEHPEAGKMGLHLHKVILPGAEDDLGRAKKTEKDQDKYFFKVPLLLNVAETAPYTHAGLIDNLAEMISFMAKNMLNEELTEDETDDIAAFLHSLTGEIPRHFTIVPMLPPGTGKGDFGPDLLPSGKN